MPVGWRGTFDTKTQSWDPKHLDYTTTRWDYVRTAETKHHIEACQPQTELDDTPAMTILASKSSLIGFSPVLLLAVTMAVLHIFESLELIPSATKHTYAGCHRAHNIPWSKKKKNMDYPRIQY